VETRDLPLLNKTQNSKNGRLMTEHFEDTRLPHFSITMDDGQLGPVDKVSTG
jgi:hypothetical protein